MKLYLKKKYNNLPINNNEFFFINTEKYNNIEICQTYTKKEKENLKCGQKIMTEMFRSFDKICRKYNLKYWCIGGTFIGTIRHNGWIPYDGDIDVCMLDTDYKIFSTKSNELPSNLWLQSRQNDKSYKLPLMKIRHLNSYYIDYELDRSHKGLQIDIYLYKKVEDDLISLIDGSMIYPDAVNMKYSEIFPLSESKFEDITVYIPGNYKDFSKKYWGNYPPLLLPVKNRYPHEGKINPYNACDTDIKLYPNIYNSLRIE
jgi:hypothetical protein